MSFLLLHATKVCGSRWGAVHEAILRRCTKRISLSADEHKIWQDVLPHISARLPLRLLPTQSDIAIQSEVLLTFRPDTTLDEPRRNIDEPPPAPGRWWSVGGAPTTQTQADNNAVGGE